MNTNAYFIDYKQVTPPHTSTKIERSTGRGLRFWGSGIILALVLCSLGFAGCTDDAKESVSSEFDNPQVQWKIAKMETQVQQTLDELFDQGIDVNIDKSKLLFSIGKSKAEQARISLINSATQMLWIVEALEDELDKQGNNSVSTLKLNRLSQRIRGGVSSLKNGEDFSLEDITDLLDTLSDLLEETEKVEEEIERNKREGEKEKKKDAVDLGIRNAEGKKVCWATCNIGAENPWEYGDYYAWGETETHYEKGWKGDGKSVFDGTWRSPYTSPGYADCHYKHCKNDEMIKYCDSDGLTILDNMDDVAYVTWGEEWRMPTNEEYQALFNNCYWEWTDNYQGKEVAGYIAYKTEIEEHKGLCKREDDGIYRLTDINMYGEDLTSSITTYPNYNLSQTHIFFPFAGCFGGGYYDFSGGEDGEYWSSSLVPTIDYSAHYFSLDSFDGITFYDGSRPWGRSIRAVCVKE